MILRKAFLGVVVFGLGILASLPTTGQAEVSVHISLPPPIVFGGPPALIVLPETYVYVVPDVEVDLFFYNGWWWRPWEGRWYRSRYHNSGWVYYQRVPSFYRGVPPGWRNDYRDHRWRGHQWNYQRIPHHEVQQNWQGWKKNKHWEKQQTWGVQGLKRQPRAEQPSRQMQPRQAQPGVQKAKPEQSRQQRQEAVPQAQRPDQQRQKTKAQSREDQPNPSPQQKGDHERGKSHKQDR